MKILVVGTRGIPNVLGGIETHCEELYPRLAAKGYDITIVRRSCYVDDNTIEYKGVKLKDIYAPRKKSFEAIVHTFLAIIYAKKQCADILHIHAIGPSILVPFARALGLRVVMTHHGPDYDRQKWGLLAKKILKLGEYMGVKFANHVIVISEVINSILKTKYNRMDAHLIHNGVTIPKISSDIDYILELGLEPNKYILALGRFVPEKGFDGLIDAFFKLDLLDYKLVLAGDADHEDEYSTKLKKIAQQKGAVLTGFIKGERLNQLFSNTRLFVLPSFHEGLPISLLEAMSYKLDVLVSDIPANLEVGLEDKSYFKSGDWNDLSVKINNKLLETRPSINYNLNSYDWEYIANEVANVYELKKNNSKKTYIHCLIKRK